MAKIENMKHLGQRQNLIRRIVMWLEENVEVNVEHILHKSKSTQMLKYSQDPDLI